MTKSVVTGQPPSKRGRFAVGPFRNENDGRAAVAILGLAGWAEVWLLPLDEAALDRLVAAGIRV